MVMISCQINGPTSDLIKCHDINITFSRGIRNFHQQFFMFTYLGYYAGLIHEGAGVQFLSETFCGSLSGSFLVFLFCYKPTMFVVRD